MCNTAELQEIDVYFYVYQRDEHETLERIEYINLLE